MRERRAAAKLLFYYRFAHNIVYGTDPIMSADTSYAYKSSFFRFVVFLFSLYLSPAASVTDACSRNPKVVYSGRHLKSVRKPFKREAREGKKKYFPKACGGIDANTARGFFSDQRVENTPRHRPLVYRFYCVFLPLSTVRRCV